jgi:tRNA1(Val) A37 N6-methylase TrmN6
MSSQANDEKGEVVIVYEITATASWASKYTNECKLYAKTTEDVKPQISKAVKRLLGYARPDGKRRVEVGKVDSVIVTKVSFQIDDVADALISYMSRYEQSCNCMDYRKEEVILELTDENEIDSY